MRIGKVHFIFCLLVTVLSFNSLCCRDYTTPADLVVHGHLMVLTTSQETFRVLYGHYATDWNQLKEKEVLDFVHEQVKGLNIDIPGYSVYVAKHRRYFSYYMFVKEDDSGFCIYATIPLSQMNRGYDYDAIMCGYSIKSKEGEDKWGIIKTYKMSADIIPHPDLAFIGRFEDGKVDHFNWEKSF